MSELVERTGVAAATVRYYLAAGVLPPPAEGLVQPLPLRRAARRADPAHPARPRPAWLVDRDDREAAPRVAARPVRQAVERGVPPGDVESAARRRDAASKRAPPVDERLVEAGLTLSAVGATPMSRSTTSAGPRSSPRDPSTGTTRRRGRSSSPSRRKRRDGRRGVRRRRLRWGRRRLGDRLARRCPRALRHACSSISPRSPRSAALAMGACSAGSPTCSLPASRASGDGLTPSRPREIVGRAVGEAVRRAADEQLRAAVLVDRAAQVG